MRGSKGGQGLEGEADKEEEKEDADSDEDEKNVDKSFTTTPTHSPLRPAGREAPPPSLPYALLSNPSPAAHASFFTCCRYHNFPPPRHVPCSRLAAIHPPTSTDTSFLFHHAHSYPDVPMSKYSEARPRKKRSGHLTTTTITTITTTTTTSSSVLLPVRSREKQQCVRADASHATLSFAHRSPPIKSLLAEIYIRSTLTWWEPEKEVASAGLRPGMVVALPEGTWTILRCRGCCGGCVDGRKKGIIYLTWETDEGVQCVDRGKRDLGNCIWPAGMGDCTAHSAAPCAAPLAMNT
ncbi:hypothetical protein O3P69_001455 [Scylla paramamosain]|uniref:Uncharacterized protein n=1 Tax=Scylla paramamosain TaxID=85552 RepID=A0AAW0UZ50_SCYPA